MKTSKPASLDDHAQDPNHGSVGIGLRRLRGRGFTLIELAVCLIILGLLTGTAALSLRGLQHNMDLETWDEQIAQLDHLTRQRAEQQGKPWRMVFDLERQRVWAEPQLSLETPSKNLKVPRGWALDEVLTSDEQANYAYPRTTRQVTVTCSTQGVTSTYALRLSNSKTGHKHQVLVVGSSGQRIELNDEHSIEDIFTALR
ncbi:MAG: prepilin-type N-terminal cleavage/methylation domain-containing protein [Planctomycetota bacterium]